MTDALARALLAAVLLLGTVPASAAPSLHRQVTAGQPAELTLELAAGDYVAGRASASAGRYRLDLRAPDGSHLRRLADAATGGTDFMLVAERDGPVVLHLAAEGLADARIEVGQVVPVAQQVAPASVPQSPTLARLATELAEGGSTDRFWQEMAAAGTPLVEPAGDSRALVTFLWRGVRQNVRIFGAPSDDHETMERLGQSDVWFRSFEVPSSTRLSYRLAPDVPALPGGPRQRRRAILATAQADPLNRHPWPSEAPDRFNQSSTLTLPDTPSAEWVEREGAPAGSLERLEFQSALLGNSRSVQLYRPPGYDPADPGNRLLILFDGAAYTDRVPTPRILDNLIAAERIPPTLALFVDNPDMAARGRELPGNPDFADMLATELMPWLEGRIGSAIPARHVVLAGSSYGGLAATFAALRHSGRFGNVLSQSGSFWWSPEGGRDDYREHYAGMVVDLPRRDLRFYLSAGLFEGDGILRTNRHLRDVLRAKGYPVVHAEHAAAHDYFSWRATLAEGLIALLGEGRGVQPGGAGTGTVASPNRHCRSTTQ